MTPSIVQSDVVEMTISTSVTASMGPHEESSEIPFPSSTIFAATESGGMSSPTSSGTSPTEFTEPSDGDNGSMPMTGTFSLRTCFIMLSVSVIILSQM
jgi:hypothetical protein